MGPKQFKTLRITVVIILMLLAIQYELGMAVNISDPAAVTPFSFSLPKIDAALLGVGGAAPLHAGLGGLLGLLSIIGLVLTLRCGVRRVQIIGSLAFLTMVGAVTGGVLFVLSGFQDDHYSHQMATGFILTFTLYFLELYFLKPDSSVTVQ